MTMTGKRGRVRVQGSPWQGVVDAAASAARQFSDPVAMEGMNAATTAHIAIQALGEALSNVGKTTVDTVAIDPRVVDFMQSLGQYVLKAVQPTEDMATAITKAHAEKINRIEEDSNKEAKWDLTVHRGRSHTGRRAVGRRRAV